MVIPESTKSTEKNRGREKGLHRSGALWNPCGIAGAAPKCCSMGPSTSSARSSRPPAKDVAGRRRSESGTPPDRRVAGDGGSTLHPPPPLRHSVARTRRASGRACPAAFSRGLLTRGDPAVPSAAAVSPRRDPEPASLRRSPQDDALCVSRLASRVWLLALRASRPHSPPRRSFRALLQ